MALSSMVIDNFNVPGGALFRHDFEVLQCGIPIIFSSNFVIPGLDPGIS